MLRDDSIPKIEIGESPTVVQQSSAKIEYWFPASISQHNDAIHEFRGIRVEVNRVFGYVSALVVHDSIAFYPETTITPSEAEATAWGFLKKHYPFMLDGGRLEKRVRQGIDHRGDYSFEWFKWIDEVLTDTHVAIDVRAYDGLVGLAVASYTDHLVKSKTKVDLANAVEIARAYCRKEWPLAREEMEVLQQRKVVRSVRSDTPRLVYDIVLKMVFDRAQDPVVSVGLSVDCDTGDVYLGDIPYPYNPDRKIAPTLQVTVNDSWPFCGGDWIGFLSDRKR